MQSFKLACYLPGFAGSMIAYATSEIPRNEQVTFVLITGDGDFTDALLTLKFLRHTVIVIADPSSSRHLARSASRLLDWGTYVVAKVPKWDESRPLFCGAISLSWAGPSIDSEPSDHKPEEVEYEAGADAHFLIPRSFEVLIQCLRNAPYQTVSDLRQRTDLLKYTSSESFDDYLQYAAGFDIIQRWKQRSGYLVSLTQPPWWDGFD